MIPVEKNKTYEIKIAALGSNGEGIGRIEGYTVFVEGALPSETCLVLIVKTRKHFGYGKLLETILTFFKTRVSPVDQTETIEIYTFMEAANESKRQGGKPVSMKAIYEKATKEAPIVR